jgi:hypothetical protein
VDQIVARLNFGEHFLGSFSRVAHSRVAIGFFREKMKVAVSEGVNPDAREADKFARKSQTWLNGFPSR